LIYSFRLYYGIGDDSASDRKRPGTNFTGGWVSPRAGLDGCGKSRPPMGFSPRPSRYCKILTDILSKWMIPYPEDILGNCQCNLYRGFQPHRIIVG